MRDEERGGRPSVVTDDFVQKSGTIHLRFTPSFHSRGVAQAFLDLFFRKRSRIDLTTGNCARKLYEDHKDFTTKKLKGPAGTECDVGIKKIIPRYRKCLEPNGDYVEK